MPASRATPTVSAQVAVYSAPSASRKMKSTENAPRRFRPPRYRGGCEGGVKKRFGIVTAALLPVSAFKRDAGISTFACRA